MVDSLALALNFLFSLHLLVDRDFLLFLIIDAIFVSIHASVLCLYKRVTGPSGCHQHKFHGRGNGWRETSLIVEGMCFFLSVVLLVGVAVWQVDDPLGEQSLIGMVIALLVPASRVSQRLRITSVDPLRRFRSRGEDGDGQEQE